jgi:hypothetical protein
VLVLNYRALEDVTAAKWPAAEKAHLLALRACIVAGDELFNR